MSSNPGRAEIGVLSTSVTKSYLIKKHKIGACESVICLYNQTSALQTLMPLFPKYLITITSPDGCPFHANIFLMSKMGSMIKFIGKLTKIHQKYTFGKIVILDKTNICTQRIGIQVSTVLRMRTVNLAASF